MSDESPSRRATVAVYDLPPWWRRRRFRRLAVPIIVAVASLAVWYAIFA